MPTSKLVKLANTATSARLASLISTEYEFTDSKCRVTVLHSSELHKAIRQAVWDLMETNMHDFYINSSSLGWDPKAKKKELFNSKSRFILVHSTGDLTTIPLLGYSMFRFENEEDEDAIYCYELQVATAAQGMGIGKKLMNDLNSLGRAFNMEKILLTAFKHNTRAMQFYKYIGFHVDPSSPYYIEEDDDSEKEKLDSDDELESDVDYEILSKIIQ